METEEAQHTKHIRINSDVHRRAKVEAATREVSLSAMTEEALEKEMANGKKKEKKS